MWCVWCCSNKKVKLWWQLEEPYADQSQNCIQNLAFWLVGQLQNHGGNFKRLGHVTSLIPSKDSGSLPIYWLLAPCLCASCLIWHIGGQCSYIDKPLSQFWWTQLYFRNTGPPRLARPPRPGPCLDFGFQYALIRNNQSKKFGVEYWALPGSNLPWRPWKMFDKIQYLWNHLYIYQPSILVYLYFRQSP